MNKEKVEGDIRFREGFHARAENGQGYVVCSVIVLHSTTWTKTSNRSWSMPPTNIRPGVSRMTSGGRAREDLMPGTSTSGRGLNTVSTSVALQMSNNAF